MGVFGPTKKGGGLDMRFKSNKGGYLGKVVRLTGVLSSRGSDDVDDFLQRKKKEEGAELLSRVQTITDPKFFPKERNELIELLDELSQYIGENQIMELGGLTSYDDIEGDWASAQSLAEAAFIIACEMLKELSVKEHKAYLKFFDEKVNKPKRERKRAFIVTVFLVVILFVLTKFLE